jgi:putative ABC transport system permease protein
MWSDLLYRLRALFRRQKLESDLDEELSFHIKCQEEKNRRAGMSSEVAHRLAVQALGGTEQTREACRDARGTRWLEEFLQDCRYSARTMGNNKAFAGLVAFVLAIGLGVVTAVFSIVHAVIIEPLPFRDSTQLLTVWDTYLPQYAKVGVSPVELQLWQAQRALFQETAWYRYVPLDGNLLMPGAEPVAVHADFISANFFSMLGMAPIAGRWLGSKEDPQSMLISEHLWRTRFAGDPNALGKTFRFNEEPFTVVGVMSSAAQFPEWADLWLPQGPLQRDELTNPVRHALGFVARLRPGMTKERAAAQLMEISRKLAGEHPKTSAGWGIRVNGLQEDLTGDVRPALVLLLSAASFLLLIACANIASLLLSRASGRAKEMAIRVAVGASSLRIVRQLLTESLALALLGGVLGWIVAKVGLMAVLPTRAHLDTTVILFLFSISVAAGIFFGLAPALQTLRSDPQSVIKSGTVTGGGMVARSVLIIFELSLTLMLVMGAGILAASFVRLMQVNPGFNANGVLTMRVVAPPSRKPGELFHRIQEKLMPLPGVQGIAATNALPLVADRASTSRFNVPGSPLISPDALPAAQVRLASPNYFSAMQIPVRTGRIFSEQDLNQPVCIINETMAHRFWPHRDPVGIKFINGPWGPNPNWATIVGVVGDVKQFGLDAEPSFDIYYPSLAGQYLVVKSAGDPLALGAVLERTLHSIDPELAIGDSRSMGQIAAESARTRRWTLGLLAAFASVALLLALVGIYGVISWSVTQRRKEVGIRMALGAQRGQVLALVLRYGLKLTLLGLGLGILASFALRHTLASFVYGVSAEDPIIYACVPVFLFAAALLACYVPARRASGIDPVISLRYE